MNAAYLAPIIGLVVAALLAAGALMLIRRPAVRAPGPTPHVPAGRRVVVIGGGFGGLQAVNKLRHKDVDVTLIDRRNFHLFQPLVYQVATGALSPGEIATPLRAVFKRAKNVRVMLGEVSEIDLERRIVHLHPPMGDVPAAEVPYDQLIVAAGSKYSYFGHPRVGAVRARGQVARARARGAAAHPRGVRGGGARERPGEARAVADVRGRRRGPDRGRDGGPDRRARARRAAARLPRDGPRPPGGSCWSRRARGCWPRSRPTCRRAPCGSWTASA